MYTEEMAKAFHAIVPPGDFKVDLYDNDKFITIMIDPNDLVDMSDDDKRDVAKYIISIKESLESLGAIVFIVREALDDAGTSD